VKLYDAARCPYCARVRIALAEKGLEYETVEVDLTNRPPWIYDLNATGRVPVLDDGFLLPESPVIMEYLEERYPDVPLLPDSPAERGRARVLVHRFDDLLGDDYYAYRRGDANELAAKLEAVELGQSLYVDVAFAPWIIRARDMLGVELPPPVAEWLDAFAQRPSVARELEVVAAL
jgi:glutathione S-transferase